MCLVSSEPRCSCAPLGSLGPWLAARSALARAPLGRRDGPFGRIMTFIPNGPRRLTA